MGVDISGILVKHNTSIKDYNGQTLTVDSYNTLYQFLSNIRQPDGTPLMDHLGRVTSHLSGVFYRTTSMIQNGIRPVYVFDGKPPRLKNRTLEERKLVREKNRIELEKAVEAGDEPRIRSLSSRMNYVSREIVSDTKTLLSLMGLPYIEAPSEGEAQASWMCSQGLANGVISQDYDSLLFGARILLRNFAFTGKRKLPGRNIYVNVSPEYVDLGENLENLHITREQLVDIGLMVGTDFNRGLERVGAKTALNLIGKHGNIFNVLKAKGTEIENIDEIREIFLNPDVVEVREIEFSKADGEGILNFLCDEHSFSRDRVSPYVKTLIDNYGRQAQKSLDRFF